MDWADKLVTLLSSLAGVVVGAYLTRQANQRAYERQTERAAKEARLAAQHDACADYVALVATRGIRPPEHGYFGGLTMAPSGPDPDKVQASKELARVTAKIAHAFGSHAFAQAADESIRVLAAAATVNSYRVYFERAMAYCDEFEHQMRDAILAFESEMRLPTPPVLPKTPQLPPWIIRPDETTGSVTPEKAPAFVKK